MSDGDSPTRSRRSRRVLGAGVAAVVTFGLVAACRQDPAPSPTPSTKSAPTDPAVAATCQALYPALGPRFPGEVSNEEAIERTTDAYRNALATAPSDVRTALIDLIEVSSSLSSATGTSLPNPLPMTTSTSAPMGEPKGESAGGGASTTTPDPVGSSTSAPASKRTTPTDAPTRTTKANGTTTVTGATTMPTGTTESAGTMQGPTSDRLSRAIEQQAALEGWYQAYCP